jgi:hypothetical protein
MNLLNLKNQTKDELTEYLSSLTEKETKNLQEQQETYLLCYPKGTGDDELEELLQTLDQYWYPDYYNE